MTQCIQCGQVMQDNHLFCGDDCHNDYMADHLLPQWGDFEVENARRKEETPVFTY